MSEIKIFDDIDQIADEAIKIFDKVGRKEVSEKGNFFVAISGGKTPKLFFEKLVTLNDFPWGKTNFFFVDERFLPHGDKNSNFHLFSNSFLRKIKNKTNVYPMPYDSNGPVFAADKYSRLLTNFFEGKPKFDLIFLGIGADGHTASLFNAEDVEKSKGKNVVSIDRPDVNFKRISLSIDVINNAKKIVFMAASDDKAFVLNEIINKKNKKFPSAHVQNSLNDILFLLDQKAAIYL